MHTPNMPKPERSLTTREIADLLDELITVRIAIHCALDKADLKSDNELCELIKRDIADGFRQHSGAKGVYKL